MLKNVRIAIGVALLLLAAFAGYSLGAWRLDKAQAEIARLKQAGDEALKSAQAAQAQAEAQLKALSTEQAAKELAMAAKFEADRKDLGTLLDQAGSRGSALEAKRAEAEARRAQLQKELDEMRRRPGAPGVAVAPSGASGASGASPAAPGGAPNAAVIALEDEAARQAAEIKRLSDQIAGLKCEDAVVPDEEVLALNRAARADVTGAPK